MTSDVIVLSPLEVEKLIETTINRTIEKVVKNLPTQPTEAQKEILTITDASELLNLAKPTIYGLTSKGEIPYFKKGKKLYFKRSELLDWLNGGRHKTNAEIEQEATNYIKNQRV